MKKIIDINQLKLIGEGTQKKVYQHPTNIDKVIKIMRTELVDKNGGILKQSRLRAHRQNGVYRQFRREVLQYMQLCKNNFYSKDFNFPVETIYGFIETNQGLGLVTEKIYDLNHKRTISLENLYKNKALEKKHIEALKRFFKQCEKLHVVFGEVNQAGIMYTESRNNIPEFVLVDGIGDKLFIPFRSISKTINSRYIHKIAHRISKELDLVL